MCAMLTLSVTLWLGSSRTMLGPLGGLEHADAGPILTYPLLSLTLHCLFPPAALWKV